MYVLGSKLVSYLYQNADMWTSFANEDVSVTSCSTLLLLLDVRIVKIFPLNILRWGHGFLARNEWC